jgi:hypothetical protein
LKQEGEVRLATALLFALASYSASAQDSAKQAERDGAEAELSICLSFYSILMECAESQSQTRSEAESAMLRVGKLMMDAGEAAHLQPSEEQLRLDLNVLDQRTFIGNSCRAVDTLGARYADQCGRFLTPF